MRGLAVALLIAGTIAVSLKWGSFVAGGSDSYCYVHQAERWAEVLREPFRAPLQVVEPLALEAPWPHAALSFAPTGHVPSAVVRGANVPICPAGYSLLMAPMLAIGGVDAAFLAGPLLGGLLVLATYLAGARFGARVGLAAAALTATSPIFLYQIVQPMSDVPAAALWVLAVAAATGTRPREVVLAGLATSAAILVRPNLVPLGFVIGIYLLLRPERRWPDRFRAAATYAAWCVPGCVAVALIQHSLYGSAFASGYGTLETIYDVSRVGPNAGRYFRWLIASHTPVVLLAAAAPFLLPGHLVALCASFFAVNLALYLPYIVFEDWSYLRFLLPSLPLVLIMVVAVIDAVWGRIVFRLGARHGGGGTGPVRNGSRLVLAHLGLLAVIVTLLGAAFVQQARARSAFRLQRMESRFERAGVFVRDRLPPNAFVITSTESGSVRFYSGRKTLVWDALDPASLAGVVEWIGAKGYEPYLLFERWEEPLFRARFGSTPIGALDWPPMAEIAAQVRIYRPADRARYLRGDIEPTEYAR